MLRLIHNQTVLGALLVDDIDDGLPNKEVYRLGSSADPKAYERDGYANKGKQGCYVPYSHTNSIPGAAATQGYLNLNQTPRVLLSAGKGKILGLQKTGLLTVVSFTASQIVAPVVATAVHGSNTVITGTTLSSVSPDTTSVTFAAGGGVAPSPLTLTQAQIIAAGGTISGTTISIPAAAFVTPPVATNTVKVTANEQTSNTVTLT